jgi:hypothetical protein
MYNYDNYRRNILQENFKFMEKDVTVLLCNFNKHVLLKCSKRKQLQTKLTPKAQGRVTRAIVSRAGNATGEI